MHYNKDNWKWPLVKFWPHEICRMLTVVSITVMVMFVLIFFAPFIFIPKEEPANPFGDLFGTSRSRNRGPRGPPNYFCM